MVTFNGKRHEKFYAKKHPQGRAPVAEILLPEPEINETQTMPPLLFILQKCLGGFM